MAGDDLGLDACSVEGCGRAVKSRGMCQAHYIRWWRTGETGPAEIKVKGLFRPCSMPGCDRRSDSKGLCDRHYRRLRKWGDPYRVEPNSVAGPGHPCWKGDECGYHAAHERVRRTRGRAADLDCVWCGGPAVQWAYDHSDSRVFADAQDGQELPYSPDVWRYQPMCVPCHKRMDLDRLKKEAS